MTNWYITKELLIKSNPHIKNISDNISNEVFDTYSLALVRLLEIEKKYKEKK